MFLNFIFVVVFLCKTFFFLTYKNIVIICCVNILLKRKKIKSGHLKSVKWRFSASVN